MRKGFVQVAEEVLVAAAMTENPLAAAALHAAHSSKASPLQQALPGAAGGAEWVPRTDATGDVWWENLQSGETTWHRPAGY